MKKLAKLALIAAVLGSSVAMASTTTTINTKALASVAKASLKTASWFTISASAPATYVVNYNEGQSVSVTIGEFSDPLQTSTPVVVTTANGDVITPTQVTPGRGLTFVLPNCEDTTCTDTVRITATGTPVFGDRGTADLTVFTSPVA